VDEGDTEVVKSKIFAVGLEIILITLLCAISGLDAPEYVRCQEVGVCEFLEVCGDLADTHKFMILMLMPVNQATKDLIRNLGVHGETFIQNFPWPCSVRDIFFTLNRYISSFQDVVFFLPKTDDKVLKNTGPISPQRESNLPSEALKFITTSIIRS